MKMKNTKAYVLIDTILILSALLFAMIEYAVATLIDFHFPAWAIYPAAIQGASIKAAYAYYLSQPAWWAALIVSIVFILWAVPRFIYPALCESTGREK